MLGRAWRSVALEALEERKRWEDKVAFASLYDSDEDERGDPTKVILKRKDQVVGVEDGVVRMEFCPPKFPLGENVDTNSLRRAARCFKRQVALLKMLDRFSAPVPALEPKVLPEVLRSIDALHVSSRK